MIEFTFKGIEVTADANSEQIDFRDSRGNHRTRFERKVTIGLKFWDFIIESGDFFALSFIKSVLQYFMQCYWKRTSKVSRINFSKSLWRHDGTALNFTARQKNDLNYLHIYLTENGKTVDEVYLDGQEVMMLDIAMGKVINLLSP